MLENVEFTKKPVIAPITHKYTPGHNFTSNKQQSLLLYCHVFHETDAVRFLKVLTFIVDSCECWKATVTLSEVLFKRGNFSHIHR